MPVHDWSRVDAGLFHNFHQRWMGFIADALNAGILPAEYFALIEQNIRGPIPDVLTLKLGKGNDASTSSPGGVAVEVRSPRARITRRVELDAYVRKASRITVRHRHGQVVAVVEIVSPGNKASQAEFRALVEKSADLLRQGVHLLVIDLFARGKRDPQGIQKAIMDEFKEDDWEMPADQPFTVAAFDAGAELVSYVEFVGVGEPLPEMPLFLKPGVYVPVPLEATYQSAWQVFPDALKGLLDASAPAK